MVTLSLLILGVLRHKLLIQTPPSGLMLLVYELLQRVSLSQFLNSLRSQDHHNSNLVLLHHLLVMLLLVLSYRVFLHHHHVYLNQVQVPLHLLLHRLLRLEPDHLRRLLPR